MHPRGRERTRKRFCKKEYVAALLSPGIGRKKLPAEPFLGALPGVSVTELLATESVFAISSLYDSFLLLQIF